MQWRYTALVERVRVCASIDEAGDDLALCRRLPIVRARASIGSVVKGFGAPAVAGANHGAFFDQCLGELPVMCGRGDMEGGVAGVNVMTYRDEEVGARILAARSDLKRSGGQARSLFEHPPDLGAVTSRDRSEDPEQRTVIDLDRSPTFLPHGYRMLDRERRRCRIETRSTGSRVLAAAVSASVDECPAGPVNFSIPAKVGEPGHDEGWPQVVLDDPERRAVGESIQRDPRGEASISHALSGGRMRSRRPLRQREELVGGNESLDDALVGPAVLERRHPCRQSRTVGRPVQVRLVVSGDQLVEVLV